MLASDDNLRGYVFAFIEMFAPHLKRSVVEQAITRMATRRARVEESFAGIGGVAR